jgi:hypothetical protein
MRHKSRIVILLVAIGGLAVGLFYPSTPKHKVDEGATERVVANQALVLLRNALFQYIKQHNRTPSTLDDIIDIQAESTLGIHTTLRQLTGEGNLQVSQIGYCLLSRDGSQPVRENETIAYASLRSGGFLVIFGDGRTEMSSQAPSLVGSASADRLLDLSWYRRK